MKLIKIKRSFPYRGINLKICLVEEDYMNAEQPVQTTKVVASNGGFVPIEVRWKETLKSIQKRSIEILDEIQMKGADVLLGLTQEIEHRWTDLDFDLIRGNAEWFTDFLNREMGKTGLEAGELYMIASRGYQGKSMQFITQANGRCERGTKLNK